MPRLDAELPFHKLQDERRRRAGDDVDGLVGVHGLGAIDDVQVVGAW